MITLWSSGWNNGSLEAFVRYYGAYAKTPKGQKAITLNFTRLSLGRLQDKKEIKHHLIKKTIARWTIPYEQRPKWPSLVMSQAHTTPTSLMSYSTSLPITEVAGPSYSWDWSWHGMQQCSPYIILPTCHLIHPSSYLPSSRIPLFTDFLDIALLTHIKKQGTI